MELKERKFTLLHLESNNNYGSTYLLINAKPMDVALDCSVNHAGWEETGNQAVPRVLYFSTVCVMRFL